MSLHNANLTREYELSPLIRISFFFNYYLIILMCKNMEIQKKSQIFAKGFGFTVYIDYVKYTSIL